MLSTTSSSSSSSPSSQQHERRPTCSERASRQSVFAEFVKTQNGCQVSGAETHHHVPDDETAKDVGAEILK